MVNYLCPMRISCGASFAVVSKERDGMSHFLMTRIYGFGDNRKGDGSE
jgi:hypothetical protein